MPSPLAIYQAKLVSDEIKSDQLQKHVVDAFEQLFINTNKKDNSWFFKNKRVFHGLYIYGSVGRGKTFLMDLFVQSLDEKIVRRQHFHAFMLWLHQELHKIKKKQDPIEIIIKNLAKEVKVLCLDEFLVHDITDAMLLATILYSLEKNGISLVTTSNVKPINLYEGGLQRKKFMPAIAWMQENMQILHLDGEQDYRTQSNITLSDTKWFSPITQDNQLRFEQAFSAQSHGQIIEHTAITINKRQLEVVKRSQSSIHFDFKTLCEEARNASDYLQLSQQYKCLFISINKAIEHEDRNTARRFITLIDVLYDTHTPLYVLSPIKFNAIYSGQELSFEMQRTVSRLTEMQQNQWS